MSESKASPASLRPLFWFAAFTLLICLLLLVTINLSRPWNLILAGFAVGLIVYIAWLFSKFSSAQRDHDNVLITAKADIEKLNLEREAMARELSQLGRYSNLLHGCTDLAEILQVSQQLLAQLLPSSAGTIYPLIDGEGLAEATHLWGIHIGNTKIQAHHRDCWAMQRKRIHLSRSDAPGSACAHIELPEGLDVLSSACIPLTAQGESLGWLYLSTSGHGSFPKLSLAIAAAEQLALALANLKLRQHLRDLSVRDPLTGLFNRRYLTESLSREMARCKRRNLPLSVMVFDLDHFKVFNDTLGHPAGDTLLVAFAHLLQMSVRNEDIACRLGGEEFIIIMPEMDLEIAIRRANELLDATRKLEVMHDGQMLPQITTSIGIAVFPEHSAEAAQLMSSSDNALYQAKHEGRDRYAIAENIAA
ncbi:MAG: sensor domain-containing diguanylate cyclase [Arenimonas sp.]